MTARSAGRISRRRTSRRHRSAQAGEQALEVRLVVPGADRGAQAGRCPGRSRTIDAGRRRGAARRAAGRGPPRTTSVVPSRGATARPRSAQRVGELRGERGARARGRRPSRRAASTSCAATRRGGRLGGQRGRVVAARRRAAAARPGRGRRRRGSRTSGPAARRRSRHAGAIHSIPVPTGPQSHFWPDAGVERAAQRRDVDRRSRRRPARRRAAPGRRRSAARPSGRDGAGDPADVRAGHELRAAGRPPRRARAKGAVRTATPRGRAARPAARAARGARRAAVSTSSPGARSQAAEHAHDALARAGRQRDVGRLGAQQRRRRPRAGASRRSSIASKYAVRAALARRRAEHLGAARSAARGSGPHVPALR